MKKALIITDTSEELTNLIKERDEKIKQVEMQIEFLEKKLKQTKESVTPIADEFWKSAEDFLMREKLFPSDYSPETHGLMLDGGVISMVRKDEVSSLVAEMAVQFMKTLQEKMGEKKS